MQADRWFACTKVREKYLLYESIQQNHLPCSRNTQLKYHNYFLCIYDSKIYKPKLILLASSKIVFSSSCKIFTLALHSSTSTMWGCTAWIIWNKKVLGYTTCYAMNGTFTSKVLGYTTLCNERYIHIKGVGIHHIMQWTVHSHQRWWDTPHVMQWTVHSHQSFITNWCTRELL